MSNLLQLNKIDLAIDNYIRKLSRKNDHLDEFKTFREYKAFITQFRTAINKQMTNISEDFKNTKDSRLSGPDAKIYAKHILLQKFVPLATYIDKNFITSYYKNVYNHAVKASYRRAGVIAKASDFTFNITNQNILNNLSNQANYLLSQSSLDQTTQDQLYSMISDGIDSGLTAYEIADTIQSNIDGISSYRADMIANTETANVMGSANLDWMQQNDVQYKEWVTAGSNTCDECQGNEDDGQVPVDESFASGDDSEPAHPNCECYVNPVQIDLTDIPDSELWSGN